MAVDVETLVVRLEGRVTDFEKAMAKAQRSATTTSNKITAQFSAMNRNVSGLFRGLGLSLGTLSVAAFAKAVGDVVVEANQLALAAKKIGVSTDELQKLRVAAKQVGIDAGETDKALAKFSENIGKASAGSGELFAVLRANGVAIRDAAGNVRPLNDLLAAFADLVKNAGSESEALTLAVRGFGEGGGDFVRVLNGGADGLKRVGDEAARAGAILDRDLVAKAEALAPRWENFWQRMSVAFEEFVLLHTSKLDDFVTQLQRLDPTSVNDWVRLLQAFDRATATGFTGFGAPSVPSPTAPGKTDADELGMARVRAQQELARQLFDLQHTVPKTIIPGATTEDAAAEAAARAKAITTTVEALNKEREALGLTGIKLAEFEALTRAGITATDAMAPSVLAAADALFEAERAQDALNDLVDLFQQTTFDVFDRLIVQGEEFSDVLKDIAVQLARAAVQALLLGQGPFAGLFGTGAGGANSTSAALKTIAGAIFGGGLAEGGPVTAGRAYRVGERGPEMFVPNVSGQIIPAREGGSSPLLQVHVIPSSYFDITVDQRSAVQAQKISVQVVTGTTKAEARRRELSG